MKMAIPCTTSGGVVRILWLLSVLTLTAFPNTNAAGQPPQGKGSPVVVETVIQKRVRPVVTLIGTAEPNRTSVVAPQVEGLVIDFPVKKGQRVAKGEVLVRIEKKRLLLQLKLARANLAEVKENYQNALSELKRNRELFRKKSISSRAYDDALYKANALNKKMGALEARIETIRYDLDTCVIRAPFGGFVVAEHTQLGQWLKAGGEVVTLAEMDPMLVTIPVPDRYIHYLKKGQEVDLRFDFLPEGGTRKGTVRHIIPLGNEKARTFPVQIRIANTDQRILAGMSCKVSFPVGTLYDALLVDKDAVVTAGTGHEVFVVREGKADPRPVKKGQAYGSLVAVEGRLKPGDLVIVEGNERLRPGQPVQVSIRK
jgi:RND family efflux transporter MFP subunit